MRDYCTAVRPNRPHGIMHLTNLRCLGTCVWGLHSGAQAGSQAGAGLDNRDAAEVQAETQESCCWTAARNNLKVWQVGDTFIRLQWVLHPQFVKRMGCEVGTTWCGKACTQVRPSCFMYVMVIDGILNP
jgi:hypothetical protein